MPSLTSPIRVSKEGDGLFLSPGLGFNLKDDGHWSVKNIPPDVLKDHEFFGYLTIHGFRCTVFITPDGQQWAQKSVNTADSAPDTVASILHSLSSYIDGESKPSASFICSSVDDILKIMYVRRL